MLHVHVRPSEIDKNNCVAIPAEKSARARKIIRKTDIRISSLLRKRSSKKSRPSREFYLFSVRNPSCIIFCDSQTNQHAKITSLKSLRRFLGFGVAPQAKILRNLELACGFLKGNQKSASPISRFFSRLRRAIFSKYNIL